MNGTLLLPNGRPINRPSWWRDQAQVDARDAEASRRFFLVRIAGNDGVGEVWRCKRCRGRHTYLTAGCKERPFNGLHGALYAITHAAGDLAAVRSTGRPDYGAASPIVREVMTLPDLATAHPEMARSRVQRAGLSQFDVEMAGIRLGRIEQIPKTLAQRYLDRINQSRPSAGKLHVLGLEVN